MRQKSLVAINTNNINKYKSIIQSKELIACVNKITYHYVVVSMQSTILLQCPLSVFTIVCGELIIILFCNF